MLRRKWKLLSVILAVLTFLIAFGIAFAAVVQVSRQVPSTLTVVEVEVISDDNLFLSHDPQGTDRVTSIEFTLIKVQPPLSPRALEQSIYVRNDSDAVLTLVAPCDDVIDDASQSIIGNIHFNIFELNGEWIGNTCDGSPTVAPGETVRALSYFNVESDIVAGEFSFSLVLGAIGIAPVEPPAGMVSWWPGDGNADDIVDGNDGTLIGGASFAQGKVGQGFSFDGVDDLVEVADNANLNLRGDVTVDLWAKRDGLGSMTMVKKGSGFVGETDIPAVFNLTFTNDNILISEFELADGTCGCLFGPEVTDTSDFHHYAYVRSGNHQKLFMDGVVVAEDDFEEGPGDTSGVSMTIGAQSGVRDDPNAFCCYFNGIIDELEVFNRALSDDEIKAIFDAGSAGKIKPEPDPIQPPPGMVSWWPGDSNAGDIVDGNDGTLTNGATFAQGKVGQAFSFDGVDDFVDVGTSTTLTPDSLTIDFWMKARAVRPDFTHPLSRWGHSTHEPDSWLFTILPNSRWCFAIVNTDQQQGNVCTEPGIPLEEWHHLAGSYDGSTLKLYLDGQPVHQRPFSGSIQTNPSTTSIGCKFADGQCYFSFNGLVDEVEIFDRALSDDEIKAIFDAGSAGKIKP